MSSTRILRLDQLVEGAGATVGVRLGLDGSVADAWFAMDGMPRIEPMLVGRPVADVPGIVERICGICPAAHHLAGVRALEALIGMPTLTPTADSMRRLLHHGAVLQTHAQRLAGVDVALARDLSGFAREVVAAAGADSHFPRCAVPGGVLAPMPSPRRDELVGQVGRALEAALRLLGAFESGRLGVSLPTYSGHDLALVDRSGALDLYGDRLRAVAADGSVTVDGAGADDWIDLVAESGPDSPAPRPYLRTLGAGPGTYRVGPVAELRAAAYVATPLAAAARMRWSAADGDAAWARAVVTLHVVEVVEELLGRPELVAGPVLVETGTSGATRRHGASGWVDGARGLLVHTYRTDGAGLLSGATITTPTAQNETWLAELLRASLRVSGPIDLDGGDPGRLQAPLEAAIREADPCLPCTSLPAGRMQVRLKVTSADASGAAREGC